MSQEFLHLWPQFLPFPFFYFFFFPEIPSEVGGKPNPVTFHARSSWQYGGSAAPKQPLRSVRDILLLLQCLRLLFLQTKLQPYGSRFMHSSSLWRRHHCLTYFSNTLRLLLVHLDLWSPSLTQWKMIHLQ
jgi:hypothetical protein